MTGLSKKINVIIPAGGTSSRFGNTNKLLEKINGKEVIRYTVEAFLGANVDKIIICANPTIIGDLEEIFLESKRVRELDEVGRHCYADTKECQDSNPDLQTLSDNRHYESSKSLLDEVIQPINAIKNKKLDCSAYARNDISIQAFQSPRVMVSEERGEKMPQIEIIKGGATRQKSVYNGLKHSECDYVLIHDAARPMITTDLINQTIEMVKEKKALTVATKTIDTIKEVVDGKIIRTIDRSKLYNTQTPQAFEYNLIKEAHEKLKGQNFTDDAGMLEELGFDVYILNGSYKNIKITTQNDIDIAKVYLKS